MQVQVGRQEGKKDGLDRIGGTGENKATDIIGPDTPDSGTWSLLFGETEDIGYEIRMEYDRKRGRKTLRPVSAVTWDGREHRGLAVTDIQAVRVSVRKTGKQDG